MRIIIAGAPGAGKDALARELGSYHGDGIDFIEDRAVGALADYRTEIYIASMRALEDGQGYYTHSLLDSLCYSVVRLHGMMRNNSVSDLTVGRWLLATQMIAAMYMDTFHADLIFYLRGYEDDGIEFNKRLAETMEKALIETGYPFHTLDDDPARRIEQAKNLVRAAA